MYLLLIMILSHAFSAKSNLVRRSTNEDQILMIFIQLRTAASIYIQKPFMAIEKTRVWYQALSMLWIMTKQNMRLYCYAFLLLSTSIMRLLQYTQANNYYSCLTCRIKLWASIKLLQYLNPTLLDYAFPYKLNFIVNTLTILQITIWYHWHRFLFINSKLFTVYFTNYYLTYIKCIFLDFV